MSVFYIVLPLALLVVAAGVVAYVWAARSGQFDDTTTPPVRTVLDDDEQAPGEGAGAKRG
jgi:cbb3-type cytochrome oxidase maturation protein